MIAFDTSTRLMTVQLAGAVAANPCQWIASWQDRTDGAVGTAFGTVADATPVIVIPAPASVAQGSRQASSFSLFNADSTAVIVTVTYVDGASTHILQSVTLQAGESLFYEQNSGWGGLDVNGNLKQASNTVQVSTALSTAQAASSEASVASSMASGAITSNVTQSTAISSVSLVAANAGTSVTYASGNISTNTRDISTLSSGLVNASQNQSIASSAGWSVTISKVHSSFGW